MRFWLSIVQLWLSKIPSSDPSLQRTGEPDKAMQAESLKLECTEQKTCGCVSSQNVALNGITFAVCGLSECPPQPYNKHVKFVFSDPNGLECKSTVDLTF